MRVTRIAIIAALFTAAATTAQAQNLRFLEPGNQPFDQSGDLLVVMGEDLGRTAFDRVGEFQMRPYPFFQTRRAFKTPGLRNVAVTAPYQHDGSEATLDEVVRFYNQGGRDPNSYGKSLDIRPLNLTESELKDLVSFLEGLTAPVGVE